MGKKAVIFFDDVQTETLNCRTANRVDMLLKQCIQHGQVSRKRTIELDVFVRFQLWVCRGCSSDGRALA